jgi:hypothetical protein
MAEKNTAVERIVFFNAKVDGILRSKGGLITDIIEIKRYSDDKIAYFYIIHRRDSGLYCSRSLIESERVGSPHSGKLNNVPLE